MKMTNKQTLLIIKFQAALQNTNDLYDYESTEVQTQTIALRKGFFLAKGEVVSHYASCRDIPPTESMISYVSYANNSFFFETQYKGEEMNEKAWLPVKQSRNSTRNNNNTPETYIINQGDVLKFGRIEVKIRDIRIEGKQPSSISNAIKKELHSTPTSAINNATNTATDVAYKRSCRICFSDDTLESPLVNSCRCSGGIKYVHLNCLQKWLTTKRILRSSTSDNCIVYTYKNLECELCKTALPDLVQSGEDFYEIWNCAVEPAFKSYIIMESITPIMESQSNSSNAYKTIFIVNFNTDNEIRIGRSHDSDLRIKDLSVSRLHAQMTITKAKEVVISDLNSKFGTIVLVQSRKLPICRAPLTIQFGKNIVTMQHKLQKSMKTIFKCWSCKGDSNYQLIDYNLLNIKEIRLAKIFKIKEETVANNDGWCANEIKTQAHGNDSGDDALNKTNNIYSSIEEEMEIETINNISNCFGLKFANEHYFEKKKAMRKQKLDSRAKKNEGKKSVRSVGYRKKYGIDFENYYYNDGRDTAKSYKIIGKNTFAEDFSEL